MDRLTQLLQASAALHSHLCPRQVIGVRTALAAEKLLNLEFPRKDKRLLVILETDGCYVDGVAVPAGVSVGKRTLRIEDIGKVAATFIDTQTGQALRIAPQNGVRERVAAYAPGEKIPYYAQLNGYQVMPDSEMFNIQPIRLVTSVEAILSRPGLRAQCDRCGEEIMNEREIHLDGSTCCRTCAGQAYYSLVNGIQAPSSSESYPSEYVD